MKRDRLFLLEKPFADDTLPGREFYCKDCTTIEGLLAAFPERATNLDVTRVGFRRPRAEVVVALGEENQGLPSMAFAEGGFASDMEDLLDALHRRHGFPERHP